MTTTQVACLIAAPLILVTCALASEPGTFDRTLAVSGPVTLDIESGPGGIKDLVNAHNTSGGSIEALQLAASVRAETASGSIRLSQVNPAPIRAVTDSRAIDVELASGGGSLLDAGGPLVDVDTRSSKIESTRE